VLPAQGTAAYDQTATAFYRGLAALQVGLLDDARQSFARATETGPAEPAAWANLGITDMRLGELDAAAVPIARALALAPADPDVVLLAGRMEIARGRIDEGLARLRDAVMLDPRAVRARYTLAQEVERSGGREADAEAQRLFEQILEVAPENLAVVLERARIAAKRGDTPALRDSVARLEGPARAWPPAVAEQYAALRAAAGAANPADAVRATAVLRNVLARVPAYRDSLAAVATPTELIADPFERFLALEQPSATPAPPDGSLTFTSEAMGAVLPDARVLAMITDDDRTPARVFASNAASLSRVGDVAAPMPFPGGGVPPQAAAVLSIDWNHDFRSDLLAAGHDGVRLLVQDADGRFADATARADGGVPVRCDCVGAWAADIEMDGDVDAVLGQAAGPTLVLRNNGDGSWQVVQTFAAVAAVRGFAWADIDHDGDPDAVLLDAGGRLHVLLNRQGGDFVEVAAPPVRDVAALAVGDVNGDGVIDLVTEDSRGAIRRSSANGLGIADDGAPGPGTSWSGQELAPGTASAAIGTARLFLADLDNNGALDVVASAAGQTHVWLAGERYGLQPLTVTVAADVFVIADLNGDGRLDLAGLVEGRATRLLNQGRLAYHWKAMRARAQQSAGDQRINSFGLGGEIEIRSGLLTQKQVLTGGLAHFGLGTRTTVDVVRIVWPNGVPQAEFDIPVDDTVVATQRLKGSCPWVFADNGRGMQFVTDFLWRSPLGLRINAQDTAGTSQTADWVKIAGDQLVPRNGSYDVRITAELWETHFFDHVSLMAVDHPAQTAVFVDERFSATHPPRLAVQAMAPARAIAGAWDDRGRDVTALLTSRDRRYLATFARGAYQGIAVPHSIEIELGAPVAASGRPTLLATGWVYPTDSSINVAIAQGHAAKPEAVSLEAQDGAGAWRVVNPDVGFPAGKDKTILIDLRGAAGARRLRLRTNLEIYWDWFASAEAVDAALTTRRLPASRADLQFRGFSETSSPRGESPETPHYQRVVNGEQRWRDLAGYYTRFGDVKELLAAVDDRYVIMNAGDELRLQFAAPPLPAAGWQRDFVLIGDGWEKDGDYNTSFSKTVLPLPTHARSSYAAASTSLALEDDPVYKAHPSDWQQYHTRYVTPDVFLRGLRTH
jgi:Tfp pilus assembly protein PilF